MGICKDPALSHRSVSPAPISCLPTQPLLIDLFPLDWSPHSSTLVPQPTSLSSYHEFQDPSQRRIRPSIRKCCPLCLPHTQHDGEPWLHTTLGAVSGSFRSLHSTWKPGPQCQHSCYVFLSNIQPKDCVSYGSSLLPTSATTSYMVGNSYQPTRDSLSAICHASSWSNE